MLISMWLRLKISMRLVGNQKRLQAVRKPMTTSGWVLLCTNSFMHYTNVEWYQAIRNLCKKVNKHTIFAISSTQPLKEKKKKRPPVPV